MANSSVFARIDKGFESYYVAMGRLDYKDEDNIGKFQAFCNANECEPEDFEEEMADADNCLYIDFFDEDFPFSDELTNDDAKTHFIFEKIKQFAQTKPLRINKRPCHDMSDDEQDAHVNEYKSENNQMQKPSQESKEETPSPKSSLSHVDQLDSPRDLTLLHPDELSEETQLTLALQMSMNTPQPQPQPAIRIHETKPAAPQPSPSQAVDKANIARPALPDAKRSDKVATSDAAPSGSAFRFDNASDEIKEDLSWNVQVAEWYKLVEHEFDDTIAKAFKATALDMFDEKDGIIDDLEQGKEDWSDSAFMDQLRAESLPFIKDERLCKSFHKWLIKIVKDEHAGSGAFVKSPKDVEDEWREALSNVDDVERQRVTRLMNKQCPSAIAMQETFLVKQNLNLMNALSAGRIDDNEPVTFVDMYVDIYELSLANQIVKEKQEPDHEMDFRDERAWVEKMAFFRNYPGARIIQEAVHDYHHRLVHPIAVLVVNKIQDDVNVYIGYTLAVSQVIASLMGTYKESPRTKIYPMQIDLVIIGRNQVHKSSHGGNFPLSNPLPPGGMRAFLRKKLAKIDEGNVSLQEDQGRKAIEHLLGKYIRPRKSRQRVIVVIDRSAARHGADEDEKSSAEDKLLVYQLPIAKKISEDYYEAHMSWMAQKKLFPWWDGAKNDGSKPITLGGDSDIGDAGFVVSFHVHNQEKVKVEQFIKGQRTPFLPHHMLDLWPVHYFEDDASKPQQVDKDKYSIDQVYQDWKLPKIDKQLNTWIKYVDPGYYKTFSERHWKYVRADLS